MSREKIVYLTSISPFTKRGWSGIPFFLYKNLSAFYDVSVVILPSFRLIKLAGFYFGRIFYRVTKRRYVFDYGIVMALLYGLAASWKMRNKQGVKFIFSPAGLTEIAFLRTSVPIVSFGDCSALQILDYYPAMQFCSKISRREIKLVEYMAFRKAAKSIFSSKWAAGFILYTYGKECSTAPFGSNLLSSGHPKRFLGGMIKLLFVGVDWWRKGGTDAIAVQRRLRELGVASELAIVGSVPDDEYIGDNVSVFPFIDKGTVEGEKEYTSLLSESTLLLLPSHADCTPIVIAEAYSFGTPVLATDTGGISSMVTHGVTGCLFERGDVEGYVQTILGFIDRPAEYESMSRNCIAVSNNTFNWNTWASNVADQCKHL